MRQLTCTGPGTVEWSDVPEPELRETTDALVRPIAVARCDIDLTLIGIGPIRADRFALGHEAVAEIVAVGDEVKAVQPGVLALPAFQISCGSCDRCRQGRTAACSNYPILSDFGMEPLSGVEYGGMLSDLVRVPHADAMLTPLPDGIDPIAVASLPDNVVDGYRLVAPHLARFPNAELVIAAHGGRSISLYAAQAAVALGAGSVTFAGDDEEVLRVAERIGLETRRTDFGERPWRTWPVVVDCGTDQAGLQWSIRATEPEGIVQCMASSETAASINLLRLYTLGIQIHIGRANASALIPEVLGLVRDGRLQPGLVTTDVVPWDEADTHYAAPSVKLVVHR